MNDIEAKALALLNGVSDERAIPRWTTFYRKENGFVEALCRAIEQHETFKQTVSDAVESVIKGCGPDRVRSARIYASLHHLILPKPKPDPLYECLEEALARNGDDLTEHTDRLRAALEARGLEIRSKSDDR